MGGEWAERADTIVWLLREVTKKHAKLSGAGKSNWIYKNVSGQSIHRGVPILPTDAGDWIGAPRYRPGDGRWPNSVLVGLLRRQSKPRRSLGAGSRKRRVRYRGAARSATHP